MPEKHWSQRNRKRTALRAFSSPGLVFLSSLRLVFLFSSKGLGSREMVAVEPSSRGQEPADPETLEAETAPASSAAMRAARPPTTCSTLAIWVVMVATDCESDWISVVKSGEALYEHGDRCQR